MSSKADAAWWRLQIDNLRTARKFDEALSATEHLLTLEPNSVDDWLRLDTILGKLGRHKDALDACEQAIRINPASAPAWNNKAVDLEHLERHEDCLVAARQARELDPALAPAWSNEGMALVSLRRYDEALRANARRSRSIQILPPPGMARATSCGSPGTLTRLSAPTIERCA